MEGIINNYRRNRHTTYNKHIIISVDGVDSREKAEGLVGKQVMFKTETGKEIKGKVASAHGNKGCVRAIFEKGLPGQSLGTKVQVS